MIYTVGHEANYRQALAEHNTITKLKGGYALKTIEDAQRLINELGFSVSWCVWGIEADWIEDTYTDPQEWPRFLNRDAVIVDIGNHGLGYHE